MGAPENIKITVTPRENIPPIQLLGTPVISTPRNFLFDEDVHVVLTPKTPVNLILTPTFTDLLEKSALMDAIERGDAEQVSELIDLNVDINESYVCNMTPLIVATKNGQEEIVSELLCAGAEVNQKDCLGRTSLMWACISYPQNEFIVWRLLNAGASKESIDFGYGMSQKIATLLSEFDSGLLLPRDSEETLHLMNEVSSQLIPDLHEIAISFLTLSLPSLKNTITLC